MGAKEGGTSKTKNSCSNPRTLQDKKNKMNGKQELTKFRKDFEKIKLKLGKRAKEIFTVRVVKTRKNLGIIDCLESVKLEGDTIFGDTVDLIYFKQEKAFYFTRDILEIDFEEIKDFNNGTKKSKNQIKDNKDRISMNMQDFNNGTKKTKSVARSRKKN